MHHIKLTNYVMRIKQFEKKPEKVLKTRDT